MFFQQRPAANATLSYFFGCAGHGKAIAVDVVAGDEDWFLDQAQRAGVKITHVIDTHVHADHYSGGPELARRAGAAYCLHESDQDRVGARARPAARRRALVRADRRHALRRRGGPPRPRRPRAGNGGPAARHAALQAAGAARRAGGVPGPPGRQRLRRRPLRQAGVHPGPSRSGSTRCCRWARRTSCGR